MEQDEAIGLIKDGLSDYDDQYWADLGSGTGTFTQALAQLLPLASHIVAVDKDRQRFHSRINNVSIAFVQSDFIKDMLSLADLDGILMANSLHYVKDKVALFRRLEISFRDECRFVIVEYENRRANPWVPYPIPFLQLADLAAQLGYRIEKLSEVASRFGGSMYSALLLK